MKNILMVLFSIAVLNNYCYSQCEIEVVLPPDDLATAVNIYLGQSFTACSDGFLSEISVLFAADLSNIELQIFSGEGIDGKLLGTVGNIQTHSASSATDFTVIDLSNENISVTSGFRYTYYFKNTRVATYHNANGVSVYSGGQAYADGNPMSMFDFIFRAKIVDALPVELASFEVTRSNVNVTMNWETATELNNYGFEVERASLSTATEKNYEKIGFVEGNGNSNSVKSYSFIDSKPVEGKAVYRLKQIDLDGKYEYSKEIEVSYQIVKEFALAQNYPNPFNPTTNISFKLAESGKVSVKIFNAIGQEVAELVNKTMEAGSHEVTFNASELPSGAYFCRMNAGGFTKTSKMLLIK